MHGHNPPIQKERPSSSTGKILAKMLSNRLNIHLDQTGLIPARQCGFRKDRATKDMITTRKMTNRMYIYIYIYLTNAFDTVSRDGLWKMMSKFEVWLSIQIHIAMMRQLS